MAWTWLLLAGLLEVLWASLMKASDGFTKPAASAATVATMLASFGLLALALRTLPVGTAYAVWSGVGALGTFAVGVAIYGEPLTAQRALAAALILGGIALFKLSSG